MAEVTILTEMTNSKETTKSTESWHRIDPKIDINVTDTADKINRFEKN